MFPLNEPQLPSPSRSHAAPDLDATTTMLDCWQVTIFLVLPVGCRHTCWTPSESNKFTSLHRVLSHLPHLVRLNRTRVRFPSWFGSFGQVRMQHSHSGVHQKRTKQAYRNLLEEVVSVRFQTNPGAVRGENAIRPQIDPTAKRTARFWTKPAAVVSCAVHYRMRKCFLTVCSFAWQVVDKLGIVRRYRESTQLSLHNSSVLSAAFYSCLCLLPGASLEFSRTLFLTNRKAVYECVQRHI